MSPQKFAAPNKNFALDSKI